MEKYNLKFELGTTLYCVTTNIKSDAITIRILNDWKYSIDSNGIFITSRYLPKYKLEDCFATLDEVMVRGSILLIKK